VSNQACTYVTAHWGVHDERWAEALRSCGYKVETISLERDHTSIDEVLAHLHGTSHPILAGPLSTVTKGLLGTRAPLFGLSWGFDLVQANDANEELAWLQRLSGLIVDSEYTSSIALRSGMNESQIHRIPWGIDLNTFTPDGPITTPTELGIPAGRRIILSLRALEPVYRVGDIIRAFAAITDQFPDTHLVVGNDGSLRDQLAEIVNELHIANRVSFIGHLGEKDLPPLLRTAACYVSASEVDGSSVTLLQAMGCGTPVVVSNTPGNCEWVQNGETGHLFDVREAADLARALSDILKPSLAGTNSADGLLARALVESRANWTRNSRQLTDILRA